MALFTRNNWEFEALKFSGTKAPKPHCWLLIYIYTRLYKQYISISDYILMIYLEYVHPRMVFPILIDKQPNFPAGRPMLSMLKNAFSHDFPMIPHWFSHVSYGLPHGFPAISPLPPRWFCGSHRCVSSRWECTRWPPRFASLPVLQCGTPQI